MRPSKTEHARIKFYAGRNDVKLAESWWAISLNVGQIGDYRLAFCQIASM